MKFYTKETYSFLVSDTTLPSDNPLRFRNNLNEITKILLKIEQSKVQFDLQGQIAKISALLSVNLGKYEFLTGKDVLPQK